MNTEGLPRHIIKAMREASAELVALKNQLFELQTLMCVLIASSPDEKIEIPVAAIHQISTMGITDIIVDKQGSEGKLTLMLAKEEPKDASVLHLPN